MCNGHCGKPATMCSAREAALLKRCEHNVLMPKPSMTRLTHNRPQSTKWKRCFEKACRKFMKRSLRSSAVVWLTSSSLGPHRCAEVGTTGVPLRRPHLSANHLKQASKRVPLCIDLNSFYWVSESLLASALVFPAFVGMRGTTSQTRAVVIRVTTPVLCRLRL